LLPFVIFISVLRNISGFLLMANSVDLEKQIKELQEKRAQNDLAFGVRQTSELTELYGETEKEPEYYDYLGDEEGEELSIPPISNKSKTMDSFSAPKHLFDEMAQLQEEDEKVIFFSINCIM
jgi:hypothetical protein